MTACTCAIVRVNDPPSIHVTVRDASDVAVGIDQQSPIVPVMDEYEGPYQVTPTESVQVLETNAHHMADDVTVDAIPPEYIVPSGTYAVTSSGTHDVTQYASASVAAATPTNDSESGYITSSGVRKWRYRPKTIVPTAGWAAQRSASNPINGFWQTFDAIPTGTTVTPTTSSQTIGGADTMLEGAVTVAAIPPEYIVPSGTKAISANGEGIDVTEYAEVDVDVQPSLQSKTATPSTSQQTITPDSGYDGLSSVTVDAMPSGSAGTPSATKGTVSNHAISVTPSVTNSTGYITGGTKTGTAVSVSASELVSSTYTVGASGTHDVTNYASASVASGGATASATKGTVSNHSVTVTPSVTRTAGYVTAGTSSGTAVTVSASELVSGSETKTANGTYDVTNLAELVVNVSGGGGSGLTKIATKSLGTISTTSTTATDTGQTLAITGFDAYDLLVCIAHVATRTNNRHVATVRLLSFAATSTVDTKTSAVIATSTQHYKLSSSGVLSERTGTTPYGVYINAGTISTATPRTLTLTIYQRYNSTSTGTINGSYVLDVYGVKLQDLF